MGVPSQQGGGDPGGRDPGAVPRALALVPALAFALWAAGPGLPQVAIAFALAIAAVALVDVVARRVTRRPPAGSPWDVLAAGLLVPFCLPTAAPAWLVLAAAVAVGGLRHVVIPGTRGSLFQPHLLVRLLLWLALPDLVGGRPGIDAISGATPLGLMRLAEVLKQAGHPSSTLAMVGVASGSLAESLTVPLVAAGLVVTWWGAVRWRIPATFVATLTVGGLAAWLLDDRRFLSPAYTLMSGDLALAAFFLAPDPRTSPRGATAQALFGAGCGALALALQAAGWVAGAPLAAVLGLNLLVPALDRSLPPRPGEARAPVPAGVRLRRVGLRVALACLPIAAFFVLREAWPPARDYGPAREARKAQTFHEMNVPAGADAPDWVFSRPAGVWLTRSEVTVAQYAGCVLAGRCDSSGYEVTALQDACNAGRADRTDHPMNCVNLRGARDYCAFVDGRLPTGTEWEAEASAGGTTIHPWGDAPPDCDRAVWAAPDAGPGCGAGGTAPVCSRPAGNSAGGLCDLAGNVWEWTEGGDDPDLRDVRGGGWSSTFPADLGAGSRRRLDRVFRGFGAVGFRCARDVRAAN